MVELPKHVARRLCEMLGLRWHVDGRYVAVPFGESTIEVRMIGPDGVILRVPPAGGSS